MHDDSLHSQTIDLMTLSLSPRLMLPKVGGRHFVETFFTWSGVGFTATLLADALDRFSTISYASYYTRAINDAVGYQFWVLLSQIAVLLFCIGLPMIALSMRFQTLVAVVRHFRRINYTFFLVAFDEGALMLGILVANLIYTGDRIDMLASKSFLFSGVGVLSILLLMGLNALLWLMGEALYHKEDQSISGVVKLLISAPVKYTAPIYIVVTGGIIYTVVSQ